MKTLLILAPVVLILLVGAMVPAANARAAEPTVTATVSGGDVTAGGCGFSYTRDYSIVARAPGTDTIVSGYHFKTDDSGCISLTFPLPAGTYDVYAIRGSDWATPHIDHPVSNVVTITVT